MSELVYNGHNDRIEGGVNLMKTALGLLSVLCFAAAIVLLLAVLNDPSNISILLLCVICAGLAVAARAAKARMPV